ncbi:MAG: Gfo/Idh/MocA family oxidoreductase [Phycisphaerae bacterium]|jgi:predicted dehydrogenase|nr:Gfo/Idh/MocA family oxidoreductase [Phycisphaerae bacterium]HOO17332.1 Gfo/Idh/MocA family oxidoreductase [Phycisphaerae bacterium]HPC21217.1 Gfo/Idh/MocA family oxidoreductase [Phycisphaerae bacterium]HRS27325.1 Gfo/Idh/MocA family oxidoreductase [Phycisphaerae bacterium]HRT41419.1 Gfo/Idh/MocA family oxidoreductase [Phycisphaerae bacterium]
MSETIPVAVMGAGHMGRYHAQRYAQMAGVRVAAIVDTNVERARALAEPLGARWAAAFCPELGDIVAASVAVPTVHHLAVARPLIEAGVAVLIEKPLAPNVADAEQIAELAARHNVLVQVGHTERFNPAVQAVERLGVQPKFIETHRISPFTFRSADIGVVFDMMIHDIDILLHLMRDEVVRVDAVGVNVLGPHEDIANARVSFRRGAVANLTASRLALKTERKLRVFSETAYVSLDYQKKAGIAVTRDRNLDVLQMARERNMQDLSQMAGLDFGKLVHIEPLMIDPRDPLEAELEAFITCVRNRKTPPVSAADGVAAVRLAAQIVESLSAHNWDGPDGQRIGLSADIFGSSH